ARRPRRGHPKFFRRAYGGRWRWAFRTLKGTRTNADVESAKRHIWSIIRTASQINEAPIPGRFSGAQGLEVGPETRFPRLPEAEEQQQAQLEGGQAGGHHAPQALAVPEQEQQQA